MLVSETEKDLHRKILKLLEGQRMVAAKRILEHALNFLDWSATVTPVKPGWHNCKLPESEGENDTGAGMA